MAIVQKQLPTRFLERIATAEDWAGMEGAVPIFSGTSILDAYRECLETVLAARKASGSAQLRSSHAIIRLTGVASNLVRDKADTRRDFSDAEAWCANHVESQSIPASVIGRATIYLCRCDGSRPVASDSILDVDDRGLIQQNWKLVGSE